MNEDFEVLLKLALDESSVNKLKKRLEELKKELSTTIEFNADTGSKKVSKKISGSVGGSASSKTTKIDGAGVKSYTAQIEALQSRVDDLKATLASLGADALPSDIAWYKEELEKAENKLVDLIDKQNKLGEGTKKTSLSAKDIGDAIAKATKKAKIFTTALIGARSIYFGIRKAMSTYLSQNEELQNKLNACYYALGSLFAPVLEKIVNIFATLVGYVDVFLKALGLAGINMSKYGKSASSAAKATKQLAGIDEINNVGSSESSGGASAGNPFEDMQLDTGIVSTLEAIGSWCSTNLPMIIGLIAGVTAGVFALKQGLELTKALGIGMLVMGIVSAISYLIAYINDPSWANFGGIISSIGVALLGLGLIIGSTALQVVGVIVLIVGLLAQHYEEVMGFFQNILTKLDEIMIWVNENLLMSIASACDFVLTIVRGLVEIVMYLFSGVVTGLKKIIDGVILIFKGDLAGGIELILSGLWDFIKGVLNACIAGLETLINACIDGVNVILGTISDVANALGSIFGFNKVDLRFSKISLPRLASGTNYVPNDMLAEIHQGEAVVPKKFNQTEFFGQTSAEELNLLASINEQLEQLNRKDYTINLDGDNITQKIDNNIQALRKRQGTRTFELAR